MPQIIPIRELKNTNNISKMCQASSEPIFVTKNGYGEMVLMSMKTYEESLRRMELYHELALSEEEFAKGETKDAKMALSDVRKKYGL